MEIIRVRNVNHALSKGIELLKENGVKVSPRGISTLEFPGPVATIYTRPTERVLFDPLRDANPFFHFMESLWILAGRNDVDWISQFSSNIGTFAEDGKFWGAYGFRLRKAFGVDQIKEMRKVFKKDPASRRGVLQLWKVDLDIEGDFKDHPCNTTIYLKIRNNSLFMTVCCRSNDMLWGAYGANVVHFSILQEYIAAMLGVEVGTYVQFSDSFHVYDEREDWKKLSHAPRPCFDYYLNGTVAPFPIVLSYTNFDQDLEKFMSDPTIYGYINPFFKHVALPIWNAWFAHKRNKEGWKFINKCIATDWRLACIQWLKRRGDSDAGETVDNSKGWEGATFSYPPFD